MTRRVEGPEAGGIVFLQPSSSRQPNVRARCLLWCGEGMGPVLHTHPSVPSKPLLPGSEDYGT